MIVHTDWLLTAQRMAIHMPTATGVVADLHLGYDDCRRRAGEAIPFVDLGHQLEPLGKAIRKQGVRHLVIAGDLFEAGYCAELAREFQEWLAEGGVKLAAVVPGNHDRDPVGLKEFGAVFPNGFMVDGWRILHGNERIPKEPVVHGHVHPSVRWQGRKVPCYLVGKNRIVLPAYSLDAAGVNVAKERAWHGYCCFAIRAGRLMDMGKLGVSRPRLQRTS
jgi:putative SbcD/Mre11-related phosphoesterase